MLKYIEMVGGINFKDLMELIRWDGVTLEASVVYAQLMELADTRKIDVYCCKSGIKVYRLPGVNSQRFDPIDRMAGVPDPENAKKLLEELSHMESPFTINRVHKALGREMGFSSKKTRDLITELEHDGKVEALGSQKYMGKPFNTYQLVSIKRKKRYNEGSV